MNILISGGLGFVGSNFLELIINNDKVDKIYILDNNFIGLKRNYLEIKNNPKIKILNQDLSQPLQLDYEIKCIVHLAAAGNVVDSIVNPISNFNTNVLGTLHILELAKKLSVSKFIFSSTGGALMGNSLPPVNELTNPKPISPYGASKLACEGYINAYSTMYGFNSYILRFGNVIGPYCFHKKGVINKLFNSALTKEPFNVYGDGSSSRDYIYVKDIAKAIFNCVFQDLEESQNTFHLSTGIETSLNHLISIVEEVSNKKLQINYLPSRVGEVYRNFADYSKAEAQLNFQPNKNLKPIIMETLDWFKNYAENE